MLTNKVPELKTPRLSENEKNFMLVENPAVWIRFQRLSRQLQTREQLLNDIGKLFGSPKNDRALCVHPVYALQKLECLALRLELAEEIEKIRILYKRQQEW